MQRGQEFDRCVMAEQASGAVEEDGRIFFCVWCTGHVLDRHQ